MDEVLVNLKTRDTFAPQLKFSRSILNRGNHVGLILTYPQITATVSKLTRYTKAVFFFKTFKF